MIKYDDKNNEEIDMELNRLYDHVKFMDVVFQPKKVVSRSDDSFQILGEWWNKGQERAPYPLGRHQVITILLADMNNGTWFVFEND